MTAKALKLCRLHLLISFLHFLHDFLQFTCIYAGFLLHSSFFAHTAQFSCLSTQSEKTKQTHVTRVKRFYFFIFFNTNWSLKGGEQKYPMLKVRYSFDIGKTLFNWLATFRKEIFPGKRYNISRKKEQLNTRIINWWQQNQ